RRAGGARSRRAGGASRTSGAGRSGVTGRARGARGAGARGPGRTGVTGRARRTRGALRALSADRPLRPGGALRGAERQRLVALGAFAALRKTESALVGLFLLRAEVDRGLRDGGVRGQRKDRDARQRQQEEQTAPKPCHQWDLLPGRVEFESKLCSPAG